MYTCIYINAWPSRAGRPSAASPRSCIVCKLYAIYVYIYIYNTNNNNNNNNNNNTYIYISYSI